MAIKHLTEEQMKEAATSSHAPPVDAKPSDAKPRDDKPGDAGNDKPGDAGNDKSGDAGNDKPGDAGNDNDTFGGDVPATVADLDAHSIVEAPVVNSKEIDADKVVPDEADGEEG